MNTESNSDPANPAGLSRRTALKILSVGAIGVAAGAGSTALISRMQAHVPSSYLFLTDAEASLLVLICEQIIPRDDEPGATDAGVVHYIDLQLNSALARYQDSYRRGLESFRLTSEEVFRKPFQSLTFAEQTAAVQMVDAGRAPQSLWHHPGQQMFFSLVCDHTMQGFYGSPRHGGNRDGLSFRMLGVAYPNIVGQNRYGAVRRS